MKLRRPKLRREQPLQTAEVASAAVPQHECSFDPSVDILPSDFESIQEACKNTAVTKKELVLNLAIHFTVLFPDSNHEFGLDDALEDLRQDMEAGRDGHWDLFLDAATAISVYFPEQKKNLGLNNEVFKGVKEEIEDKRNTDWLTFAEMAVKLIILFPDRRDDLGLDDESILEGIKQAMESCRGDDWPGFSEAAAALRLLFPVYSIDKLGVDASAYQGVRQQFEIERSREVERMDFLIIAKNLAIISADEVRITERGIELINNAPLGAKQELPDRNIAAA